MHPWITNRHLLDESRKGECMLKPFFRYSTASAQLKYNFFLQQFQSIQFKELALNLLTKYNTSF